jgi:hypothetical protein
MDRELATTMAQVLDGRKGQSLADLTVGMTEGRKGNPPGLMKEKRKVFR